jgi:aspartyl-tRNA(Asn)/glutamyl-tRNA(Gln) amidotransferase subunit B
VRAAADAVLRAPEKLTRARPASEALRQIALLDAGGTVESETRGFDEARAETVRLRRKEDAPDYRYMPDPSLPPLVLAAVRRLPSPPLLG